LFLADPFTDVDSSGMMVPECEFSRQELEEFVGSDPALLAGSLVFDIKTW